MPVQATARMRVYAAIAAIAGMLVWLALILQIYLTVTLSIDRGLGLWVGIARYFGYFTILTNMMFLQSCTSCFGFCSCLKQHCGDIICMLG